MQIPRFKIRSTVELRTAPEGPGVSSDALKHLHGSVYSGFLIRLWCAARAETQHTLVECDSSSCDLEIIHPRIDIDGKSIGISSFCEILFSDFDQNRIGPVGRRGQTMAFLRRWIVIHHFIVFP